MGATSSRRSGGGLATSRSRTRWWPERGWSRAESRAGWDPADRRVDGGFLTLLGLGGDPSSGRGAWRVSRSPTGSCDEDASDLLRPDQRTLFGGEPDEKGRCDADRSAAAVRRRRPSAGLDHPGPERYADAGSAGRAIRRAPRARDHPVEIEWSDAGYIGGDDELSSTDQPLDARLCQARARRAWHTRH